VWQDCVSFSANRHNASILGIGAIFEDTILRVPFNPKEDSKLRAIHRESRLGGNVVNIYHALDEAPELDPESIRLDFISAVGITGTLYVYL
jgi:hypothetical protein